MAQKRNTFTFEQPEKRSNDIGCEKFEPTLTETFSLAWPRPDWKDRAIWRTNPMKRVCAIFSTGHA